MASWGIDGGSLRAHILAGGVRNSLLERDVIAWGHDQKGKLSVTSSY